jgi:hypothetical protein
MKAILEKLRDHMLWVEIGASVFTLLGIYIGSTTALGAACYLVSLVFWWWLTAVKKLWGIVPLNAASTLLSLLNLWRAL